MTFNRECEYAIKGMAMLAAEGGGRPIMLSEIAAREDLPLSFLSKIFQKLLKHGLVVSHRGVARGYTLSREARAVSLRTILEAIEGPDLFERCVFSHRPCGAGTPCLVHEAWRAVRPQVQTAYEKTTLHDVVEARKALGPPPAAVRRARAKPA